MRGCHEPGSPWQNGYAESFHSRLRDEFLTLEEFANVTAARELTARWKADYNGLRPHSSLDYQTPAEFDAACAASVPAPASACTSTPAAHAATDEALPVP